MADIAYTPAKVKFFSGDIDLLNDDIRVKILDINTTAASNVDAATLSEITTLSEFDGANYTELLVTTNFTPTLTADLTNHKAVYSGDPLVFTEIEAGSAQGKGILFYKFVDGDPANDIPIFWKEPTGWPLLANGGSVTVNPHSIGGWGRM